MQYRNFLTFSEYFPLLYFMPCFSMTLFFAMLFHDCGNPASCCVCNATQPPHKSFLHSHNIISARFLPEMFAAYQYVVEIACGCATHAVRSVPVASQMFRSHGGGLSRGCPPRASVGLHNKGLFTGWWR